MAEETIDKVQVELTATAKGTDAVFSQLEKRLSVLKTVLNGIDVSKLQQVQKSSKSLSLNTSGITRAEKDVQKSTDNIKYALIKLQNLKVAALGGDNSALTSFSRQAVKIQGDIDVLKEKLKSLPVMSVPTEAFTKLETEITTTRAELDRLLEKEKQAASGSTPMSNDEYVKLQTDMAAAGARLDELIAKQQELVQSGGHETDAFQGLREAAAIAQRSLDGMKTEIDAVNNKPVDPPTDGAKRNLDDLASRARKAAVSLAQLTAKGISNGFKSLRSSIGKIRSALSSISDKATKGVRTGFMKILRYGFGIRSLYVLFRRLKEAIKDSFGALQSSGAMFEETRANINALKNALLTLKFQFGAAFEPIFNAIAPALQTLINYLISVMNTISAFTAKLMGRSTYSKVAQVMSNTGSAAGGAAKNVKELNHQLQGFDELNNLTVNPGNSGGGGGGGAGSGAGAMYEEASVDSVLGDLAKELAENIRAGEWFEVGRAISDKLSEVMESIPWDSIYEKARNFGKGLADFLNGLITPRLFGDIGKTIAGALNTVFEAGGSFAKEFDWNNLGESLGTGLTDFFKTANFGQWGETVHDWVCGILDAGIALIENTDFDEIVTKLEDFMNGLQVDDIADKLWEFAKTLGGAIAKAVEKLWNDASAKEKIGSAIIGLIAVARLTGLDTVVAKAIGKALIGKSIGLASAGLSTLTLSLLGIAAAVIGGEEIGNDIGKVIANMVNDPELEEYYDDYKWWKWFPELKRAIDEGDFWDGFDLMMQDVTDHSPSMRIPLFDMVTGVKQTELKAELEQDVHKVGDMAFELVRMERDRFWKRIKKLMETNGFDTSSGSFTKSVLSKFGLGGLFNEKGEAKLGVEINTKQTGSIKSTKQMRDLGTAWQGFTEVYKDKNADLGTSMLGAFTSYEEVKTGADNFRALDRDFRSKNATYTTNMGGQITSKDQIDSVRTQYENLYNAWNSKSSRFDVNTGGQLDKFGTLDTWKTKFTNLFNSWLGKSATMSANVGGQMNKIGDTDTWVGKIKNLINNWVGKTANFNAGFNQTQGTIAGYADQMSRLYGSWQGRSADFTVNASFNADDINSIADRLIHRIKKGLEGTVPVRFGASGGIFTSSGKNSIPQYAGGTTDALSHGSLFIAGERGSEIVGNINGRTEVLNRSQIAATIKASTISGMRLFKNSQMVRPSDITNAYASNSPYGYENRAMTTSNEAILEQNRLLQEQNTLLREIANKELTVSTRDVFDATKKEANIYYERTGNSPFLY